MTSGALTDTAAARAARFALIGDAATDTNDEAAAGDMLLQMMRHRTCRSYNDEPVSDELLELLLAATFSTPSKSDLQQCSVIVVDDPARRREIGALIPTMPWITESARFLLFCGDSHRIRRLADEAQIPFANDHLDAVLNAAADAAMHLSTFIWAAESVGLGTCPISVVRNFIDEVTAIVDLPDHVFPLAGMCVGWPERLRSVSPRLPLSVTVHRDRYDDTNADSLIADYDRRRLGGRSTPPERQLDVDRWGAADLYGWSQEKVRMTARRERDQLARYLRQQGFNLD